MSALQNQRGTSFGHTGAATVAYSAMVPCYAGSLGSPPSAYPRLCKSADQGKTTTPAPPSQKVVSFSDSFVGSSLADSGLSAASTELLSHAWREGTKLQYDMTV